MEYGEYTARLESIENEAAARSWHSVAKNKNHVR
jgi:hypothetical protein